jgi:hypothetical protein
MRDSFHPARSVEHSLNRFCAQDVAMAQSEASSMFGGLSARRAMSEGETAAAGQMSMKVR